MKKVEIDLSLQALVQHGLMKIVRYENGEDQYVLTAKGEKYVEAMPNSERMRQILESSDKES